MTESRGNSWSFEDIAGYVIINVLSRFIGALLRSIIIAVGLLTLIILIVLGGIVYLFWIIAPAGLLIMLATGITLLVSNLI